MTEFTYNGYEQNPLENEVYYCYLIFDKKTGMYYSGSRGATGRNTHDLFEKYFTKSTVKDFVDRLKMCPKEFEYKIEYFPSRKEAFLAEAQFHEVHNVAKNKMFYNVRNHGINEDCGTGSLLCKDSNGKIYRVTCQEYATGNHKFVCSDRMIVRYKDDMTKTESIYRTNFDPEIHLSQFQDHVLCFDLQTKKNARIPEQEFYQNYNTRYVGITKGKITAFDLTLNKKCSISSQEFYENPERYVGVTKGFLPAVNISTGKLEIIKKEDYDKTKYRHPNDGRTVQFSLKEKKHVSITTEEYHKNIHLYMNTSTRYLFIINGSMFHRLCDLKKYVKLKYGISIPRMKISELDNKFDFIKVITKEEFINGTY
jgi:hypothetical protein